VVLRPNRSSVQSGRPRWRSRNVVEAGDAAYLERYGLLWPGDVGCVSWNAVRVADFADENLAGSRFENVYLVDARFRNVDLTNARFHLVDLTG
jgi:uncharacterized protein YjbI with pentapeptide repeats